MNFSLLKNNNGLTLTEMIVTLAISSILLTFVVSGSIFVKDYIRNWKQKDNIYEEISMINSEISLAIKNSRSLSIFRDSLLCRLPSGQKINYRWHDDKFTKNKIILSNYNLIVENILISKYELHNQTDSTILNQTANNFVPGLYELKIVISDESKLTDSITTLIRNDYEELKQQNQ